MNRNDLLVEYVREKYPGIENSYDFRIWLAFRSIAKMMDELFMRVKMWRINNEKTDSSITGRSADSIIMDELCGSSGEDKDKIHDTDSQARHAESAVQHESDPD